MAAARYVEFEGKTYRFGELCRLRGMRPQVVQNRLRNGWSVERAFTEAVKPWRRNGSAPARRWSRPGTLASVEVTPAATPAPHFGSASDPRGVAFAAGAAAFRDALIREAGRLVGGMPQVGLSRSTFVQVVQLLDVEQVVRRRGG